MKSRIISLLTALIFIETASDFQVAAQGIVRDIVIAHPGQDMELTCDVDGTEESTHWQINGSSTLISLSDLLNGAVAGHNRSGRNIVVKDIVMNDDRNGSLYQCVVVATPTMGGKLITLYVAGIPVKVNVTLTDNNIIIINGISVTITLNWEEPFNNFDPIVNYTVSCSGNENCPSNFTTTDNTTRSHNITNLTPMTNYSFSVVATNSIGSGEAGVTMITTPPGMVSNASLTCESMNTSNLCNFTWDRIDHNIVTEYQLRYCEGMMNVSSYCEMMINVSFCYEVIINVSSSNDLLTFTAPRVPDEMDDTTVNATVAAISRFGVGPSSEANTTINGSRLNSTVIFFDTQSINVLVEAILADTYEVDATFDNITVRFTVLLDIINDPKVTSNLTGVVNITQSPSNLSDVAFVMHSNGTSDEYNVTIICDLFDNSEVDMVKVIAMPEEGMSVTGTSEVMDNTNLAIVKLMLSCGRNYSFLAAGMTSNKELIGPMLCLGEYNAMCLNSPPPPGPDSPDDDDNALAIALICTGLGYLLAAVIAGGFAAWLYVHREDKAIFFLIVMWILFIASLGLVFLFLGIYLYCCRREGVKPDIVEMKDSTDLYASPKKEIVNVEVKQQELYSYARTGPINVVVPGQKP